MVFSYGLSSLYDKPVVLVVDFGPAIKQKADHIICLGYYLFILIYFDLAD